MMDIGYARVSTAKQDLDRQLDALGAIGIPSGRIYVDKRSGATTKRPAHTAALDYARHGDVIVVHTLDRLGHTVRDKFLRQCDVFSSMLQPGLGGLGKRRERRPVAPGFDVFHHRGSRGEVVVV